MFLSLEVTFTSNRMLVAASNMYVVLFSGLPHRGHPLEVRPSVVEEKCTSSCWFKFPASTATAKIET
jgi:hypothetical protein